MTSQPDRCVCAQPGTQETVYPASISTSAWPVLITVHFTCACESGFLGDGLTCTDINECTDGTANCDANASCTNTAGSFQCTCNTGYYGDGSSCTDVNECVTGEHGCDVNASCTNSIGSFSCSCDGGYTGDGYLCDDIDECIPAGADCDVNASCINFAGGYGCICADGYVGDGNTCIAIAGAQEFTVNGTFVVPAGVAAATFWAPVVAAPHCYEEAAPTSSWLVVAAGAAEPTRKAQEAMAGLAAPSMEALDLPHRTMTKGEVEGEERASETYNSTAVALHLDLTKELLEPARVD